MYSLAERFNKKTYKTLNDNINKQSASTDNKQFEGMEQQKLQSKLNGQTE